MCAKEAGKWQEVEAYRTSLEDLEDVVGELLGERGGACQYLYSKDAALGGMLRLVLCRLRGIVRLALVRLEEGWDSSRHAGDLRRPPRIVQRWKGDRGQAVALLKDGTLVYRGGGAGKWEIIGAGQGVGTAEGVLEKLPGNWRRCGEA